MDVKLLRLDKLVRTGLFWIWRFLPIEIKFSNPYPNPSDNFTSFDYLLPKATKNSKIVIRNILGIVVKEVKIFNKKGNIKLSTEELTDGIYFYSIIVNDNIFITKRLIVRH